MFLQNPLEPLDRHAAIPRSLRIDDDPWPAGADAETTGFRPHGGKSRLPHALLDEFPESLPVLGIAAIRPETHKNVPFRPVDARLLEAVGEFAHPGTLDSGAPPDNLPS